MDSIERKIFARKRFIRDKLLEYGFVNDQNVWVFERNILDGDFSVKLSVTDDDIKGVVFDTMNGEEYRQLRIDGYQGAYVNTVRSEYEQVLRDIAEFCCKDVLFAADQSNRIATLIKEIFGVEPDFPWGRSETDDGGVFRHRDNLKWFALIMNVKRRAVLKNNDEIPVDVINLKIDPNDLSHLIEQEGIFPAYHMNHRNWISILLDDSLADDRVMELIKKSFELTKK